MNQLILLALGLSVCFGLSEACGFGNLCGGGGGPSTYAAAPACASPPTIITCPGAPLQNSCSSGGGGSCGGGGGGYNCGGCLTFRRVYRRRNTRETVYHFTELVNSTDDHPVCNSPELHKIIYENLSEDPEQTKLAIHKAVTKKMHGMNFAIVCSAHKFHFLSDNHKYCLNGNEIMTCYVFQTN